MKIRRCGECGHRWAEECPACRCWEDGEATCPECGSHECEVDRDTDEPAGPGPQMGPGTPGAGELPWKSAEGADPCQCGQAPWHMGMVADMDDPGEFVVFGCVACPKCGACVWSPGERAKPGTVSLDPLADRARAKATAMWNAAAKAAKEAGL